MNKKLIALAVSAGIVAPVAAYAKPEVKWFGFGQITAQQLSQNKGTNTDSFAFGADRVRIGFKLKDGNIFGKMQIDFNKANAGQKVGVLPEMIKDIFGGYKFSNAIKIKAGQFKTPLGMDFNTSGKKLDITKRGMEKKLVLERAAGVMISGRKIAGGFGYDAFFGNPAGRSKAYGNGVTGQDNTWVLRGVYDMGKSLHVEGSYGETQTSVTGSSDYKVWDIAAKYKMGPMVFKAEYIDGSNAKNTTGRDEQVWFVHGGYAINKTFEPVIRYYRASADAYGTKASADLSNLFLGVNVFLGSNKTNGRLQLNYVITGGDDLGSANTFSGVSKGYTDNAILAQYQVSF